MFTKYQIRELGIEFIPRLNDTYNSICELQYYLEYIKRTYNIDINYTGDYRYARKDFIVFKTEFENQFTDNHNSIFVLFVYKKTKADLAGTDYREIKDHGLDNRRVFYSYSLNSLVVFVEKKMEIDQYCRYTYYNQSTIFIDCLMPKDIGYQDDPKIIEYKRAYANNDYDAMTTWLTNNFPKPTDPISYEDKIKQFFLEANQSRIKNLEESIQACMEQLSRCIETYNTEYRRLNENRMQLNALENTSTENPELIQAFKDMPNCKILDVDIEQKELLFSVETTLTQFDSDKAVVLINNRSTYVTWKDMTSRFTVEERKKLIETIFCDNARYQLKVRQVFYIDPNNNVYAKRNYKKDKHYVSNPHLDKYSCFGANGMYISKAFHDGDYAQGLILLSASCANVNLMEDMSVRHLWNELFLDRTNDNYVLDTQTGELMSMIELNERLKNPEKEVEEFAETPRVTFVPVDTFNPEEVPTEEPAIGPYEDPIDTLREMDRVEEEMTGPTAADMEATRRLIEQRRANQNTAAQDQATNGIRLTGVEAAEVAAQMIEEEEFVPTFDQADRNEYRWRDTV